MGIDEYLYVDEQRLDSYVEQIGSPIKYDKVPVWNAELSLLGPKAGGTQHMQARSLTRHEKVKRLVEYLKKAGQVVLSRVQPPVPYNLSPFVLESCVAARVIIPLKKNANDLAIWVSVQATDRASGSSNRPLVLFLLEDYRRDDGNPILLSRPSCYTALDSLLLDLEEQRKDTILGDTIGPSALKSDHARIEHWDRFVRNPFGTFEQLGCRPGPERRIRALYRIRDIGLEGSNDASVFGYPIFIIADV